MHGLVPWVFGTLYNCWTKLRSSNSWWSQETRWLYPPESSGLDKRRGKKSHVRFLAKWWPLSKSERLSSVLGEISYLGFLSSQLLIAVCSKERGHTSLFKIFFVQEDFFLRTLELYMLLTESELEMAMNLNCHPLLQLKLQSLGNVICDS